MYSLVELIISCNDDLRCAESFVFYPGMEFDSREKWWPDSGRRPTLHEGVDFCYFTDGARVRACSSKTLVPAMENGRVVAICQDFLGFTVFVEHPYDVCQTIIAVYAHIMPSQALTVGSQLGKGEIVGHFADTKGRRNRMPCHLHISFLNITSGLKPENLDWNVICGRAEVTLFDPAFLLKTEMIVYEKDNPWRGKKYEDP